MVKKKICWITSSCFMDTDYNPEIMKGLSKEFEIYWFIIGSKDEYISKEKLNVIETYEDVHIHYKTNTYRNRDFRVLLIYYNVVREIIKIHPFRIYCNVAPNPQFAIVSLFLDKNITIYAAHDGKAQNDSSSFGLMRTFAYNITFRHSKYVNMFSQAQAELMHKTYPQNKIHRMMLPLKDFGKSSLDKPTGFVRFLSFGAIIYQKNIDLLIDASEILYNKGYRNFKVSINGGCKDWAFYESHIKHPEIFECNPHFISNENLVDLFATSHFSVFPYRRVSQSGVLKLAFNYNVPVIASWLGAFKEEVFEGVNGFFFEAGNVHMLADVMEKCLNMPLEKYVELQEKMKNHTLEYYSITKIVDSYIKLFNSFIP